MSNEYLLWNNALAEQFFNPSEDNKRVFLFVSNDTIAAVAERLNRSPTSFVDIVKAGPDWVTRQGLCQRALQTFDNWRARNELRYPPYLAYLALFVLAAGLEGDFAANNYHDRLRKLVNIPGEGQVPSFDRMSRLWDDLERWSSIEHSGSLGIFRATISGEMFHVGYPISQTILAASEIAALPKIFVDAGVDSSSPLSDQELCRILAFYGRTSLRPRTRAFITAKGEHEQRDLLLAIVSQELADWDGTIASFGNQFEEIIISGSLRLSCAVDKVARRISMRFRCTSSRVLPLEATELSFGQRGQTVICEQETPNWSAPLRDDQYIDAAAYDWRIDTWAASANWKFQFRGGPVRLFIDGQQEGVAGLVEIFSFPEAQEFALAFHDSTRQFVLPWLSENCDGVHQLALSGLPEQWSMAFISSARNASILATRFPVLGRSSPNWIRLRGGIKTSRGSRYYPFALPSIALVNGSSPEAIYCNGLRLTMQNEDRSYDVPEDVARDATVVTIDVHDAGLSSRRTIYLAASTNWMLPPKMRWFDKWYSLLPSEVVPKRAISGSIGITTSEMPRLEVYPLLIEGLDLTACRRIVIVGKMPGALLDWPEKDIVDLTFEPIWAIAFGDGAEAFYCKSNSGPQRGNQTDSFNRHDVRMWREIIWFRRRTIRPPRELGPARLWRQFVKTAGDADSR